MSSAVHSSIKNATPYNAKNIPALLGGRRSLPERFRYAKVMTGCDALIDRDCGSDLFARAVLRLQQNLGLLLCDAKFGRQTYTALLESEVPLTENYITLEGRRHEIQPHGWKMICFDQEGGLDLHHRGHFGSRKGSSISGIVMHWGGLNPRHFYNVAMSPTRKISSHFGIGKDDTGVACVYQFLDLTHSAWHAGKINTQSVGIDICQQADARWFDHYKDTGIYDVELIENPSSRGPAEVISLDPELHWAVKDFVGQLMQILHDQLDSFDASLPFPDADDLIKDFNGHSVLGHHHLRKTKWDIACWWDSLFGYDHEA